MHTLEQFSLQIEQDQIAVVTLDVAGESMNVLTQKTIDEINTLLNQIEKNQDLQGVIITSGKPDSFIAGADINMISACRTLDQTEQLARAGQAIFARVEQSRIPFVAAIHGICLGGGLEFALACHYRVGTDDDKTQLGLPEVKLGLLPGSGGTQRLPRLIGVQNAMDMMLTGRQVRARKALKMGLLDDLVPQSILLETARKLIRGDLSKCGKKTNPVMKLVESNTFSRNLMFDQIRKKVEKQTGGHYPAPIRIIEVVKAGLDNGLMQGYQAEARGFAELSHTPQSFQLRQLFLATDEQKKEFKQQAKIAETLQKVTVLGGGLMGGGIASQVALKADLPVRIKDIREEGILAALNYSYKLLDKKRQRGFIKSPQLQKEMQKLSGTVDWTGVSRSDYVVEAVFEDLELKQQTLSEVEARCDNKTIFASNTSSIPISEIAANAKRPENVIGLHYFSPVEKMPLVEIIPHAGTSEKTLATTIAFARRQGKTPVVVKDSAGFYVNRILTLYINEAANLLVEGEPIECIDAALKKFGFPVGPLKLIDEVGLDIGTKILPVMSEKLGPRFDMPEALQILVDDGRKGRKNKRGFYNYQSLPWYKKLVRKPSVADESVYNLLKIDPAQTMNPEEISQRCLAQMLNEAARCLQEGVISSPRDGDIAAVFGIGFPPFLGGPFRYIDSIGVDTLVEQLQTYQVRYGSRFEPAQILLDYEAKGCSFYSSAHSEDAERATETKQPDEDIDVRTDSSVDDNTIAKAAAIKTQAEPEIEDSKTNEQAESLVDQQVGHHDGDEKLENANLHAPVHADPEAQTTKPSNEEDGEHRKKPS
ncbi:fatty acid oxidation complex subunit alpha FadJ [Gayadomonas joobiniege]|uniref:fatty acid oxidation complex subunit alpha FadJ n=1 Tax=Gayadomonas joobiniege TaxID=1234606 RepID=UPI000374193A|nr:fatty acid oxidation complex subunit alpha FadJ [Gayadomonas joobiniege]